MSRLFAVGSGSYSNVPGRLAAALVAALLLFTSQSFGAPAVQAVGPTISTIVPASASQGQTVTINGSGFGASQATGTCIHFQDQNQLNNGPTNWGLFGNAGNAGFPSPTSWSDTAITFKVPVPSDANDRRRVRPGSTAIVFFHSGGGCAADAGSGGTDAAQINLPMANTTNLADYFGDDSKILNPAIAISNDNNAGCGNSSDYFSAAGLANGLTVSNASWSAGTATLTIPTATALSNGATITVAGIRPTGYNGTFSVTGSTTTSVSYALAGNPGTFSSAGTVTYSIPITGVSAHSSSSVTLTFTAVNFFPQQSSANAGGSPALGYTSVTGMNPSGYNGTFRVTSADSTHITYSVASDPGAFVSGGVALDGVWPGRSITFGGFTFNWSPTSGCFSNAFNADQWSAGGGNPQILFNPRVGADKIGLLGSCFANCASQVSTTVTYTDNSTISKNMDFADWCGSAGTNQTLFDQMPYRNTGGNARQTPACNIYLDTLSGLDTAKIIKSITFSNTGTNSGSYRIFAIAENGTPQTTTVVTSDTNPSVHGQSVTFTATVTSAEGTPTGTVNFKDAGTTITGCGAKTLSSGQATCSTSTLTTAVHSTITAVYTPADSSFATSTSSNFSQTVNQSTSGTVVTVAPAFNNPSVHGESVAWKATVSATGNGAGTPTGTVQFKIDGTNFDTPAALVSGVATSVTTSSLSTGSHTITAFYIGNTDFSASDNTASPYSQVVNKSNTTTSITGVSLGTPTAVGQNYTVSWSVSPVSPGAGAPTGTVTISGGSGCGPIDLSVATQCTFASDAAGLKSLVATYSGDANFNGSASSGDAHTVNPANTTTTITNDLSGATVVGQAYEVDWSVVPDYAGSPTGNVTVSDGSATCFAAISAGKCNLTSTTAGAKTITATYAGDANFNTSASSGTAHTVNAANTTTSVDSNNHPSFHGQSVTFTATVAAAGLGGGTPDGGAVEFKDGGVDIAGCESVPLIVGSAQCGPFTNLSIGDHSITAIYSGYAPYYGSDNTASPFTQTVGKYATTTAVTANHNPSVHGQGVTFTATVSESNPGTPTGTVDFYDNLTLICDDAPVNGSAEATCGPITGLSTGTHSNITAVYSGDGDFATSTSNAYSQQVNKADTSITIDNTAALASTSSVVGQTYTVQWTVSVTGDGTGLPTGYVSVDGGSLGDCYVLASAGQCTFASHDAGLKTLVATYQGDDDFNGSFSAGASHTVIAADTTTSVTSDINPSVHGQGVTFTATVSVSAPGAGTATGTVDFFDGLDPIASCSGLTLVAGSADCGPISDLSTTSHDIIAQYSGDTDFNGSDNTASPLSQEVDPADTTVSVTSDINPSANLEGVNFTATVSAVAPGTGVPTAGTVDFFDGATLICDDAPLNGSGEAGCGPISSLVPGGHSITAVYSGSSDFNGDTSDAYTQTVDESTTTTALGSNFNPSVHGQGVTFNVTVSASTGTATGTVDFFDGVTLLCDDVALNGSAQATCGPISVLSTTTHSITAHFNGNATFGASTSNTVSQVVNKADTTTSVTSDVHPSVFGQAVTFTATVAVTGLGAGTPGGTVEFWAGATDLGPGTLSAGQADSAAISILSVGSHDITAVYGGDTNFNGSDNTASPYSQVVNKADTTTSVTSDIHPSVFGQGVTFTATVAVTGLGAGTPADGTVSFYDGVTLICLNENLDGSGQATCGPISDLSTATHSIKAYYSGNANFNGSDNTASPFSQVVNKANSTTLLVSDTNPSAHESAVTFYATVSADVGTPTGTVTFYDGVTAICTAVALSGDTAHCLTATLTTTSHSITAVYSGDSNYTTSTSDPLIQVVNKATTGTEVFTVVNPSVHGQGIYFYASVIGPSVGIPTGTVDFYDGATLLCSGETLNVQGGTSCGPISNLSTGTHSNITAVYSGDTDFNGSTSDPYEQVVNKADTTTSVTSDINASVFGQAVTFTATVAAVLPGVGTPNGTVEFWDGATDLGPGTLAGGQANSAPISNLSVGSHSITAVYAATSDFNTSTSPALTQVVNKADTTTSVTADVNASVFGQAVTFTATVAAVLPGVGTPTGTVEFWDGATDLGPGTLSGGQADSAPISSLSVGSHNITAVYAATTSFNGSDNSASPYSQVVNKANSTTTITGVALGTATVVGQTYTVSWSVNAAAPGAGTLTGTVTVAGGSGCTNVPVATGQCSFASDTAGLKSLVATYSGDTNFNGSVSAGVSHQVNPAATTTGVTSDVNPSVHGQGVTFTATVSASLPGAGTPTGTVQFLDGATTMCAASPLDGTGHATCGPVGGLSTSSHSITAVYSSDANYNASTSPALTQVVTASATTTTVASSVNPSVHGQAVTFTATVVATGPGTGIPTGFVQFKMGLNNLGAPVALDGTGHATSAPISTLTTGGHAIKAVYLGSSNFQGSTSLALNQVVSKAATTATVYSTPNPSTFSHSFTLHATVVVVGPGTGIVGGKVQFYIDGRKEYRPVKLHNGQASLLINFALTVGNHTVKVVYLGNANFQTKTSANYTHHVN